MFNKNIHNITFWSYLAEHYYDKEYIDDTFVPINNAVLKLADGDEKSMPLSFFSDQEIGCFYDALLGMWIFKNHGNYFILTSINSIFPSPVVFTIGSETDPSICFNFEQSGLFYSNSEVCVTTGGTKKLSIGSSVKPLVPILSTNGVVGSPSYSFASDTDTGMYLSSDGVLGFASAGTQRMTVSSTYITNTIPFSLLAGTANAPSIAFTNDLNTGIFSGTADTIKFSTGGTERASISTTALTSALRIIAPVGNYTNPSYTFNGDLDTGIYQNGANSLGFAVEGFPHLLLTTNYASLYTRLISGAGSVSSPTFSFYDDMATGMFLSVPGEIAFACGGVKYFTVKSDYSISNSHTFIANGNHFVFNGNDTPNITYEFPVAGITNINYTTTLSEIFTNDCNHQYDQDMRLNCDGTLMLSDTNLKSYLKREYNSNWKIYRKTSTSSELVLHYISDVGGAESINWSTYANGDTKSTTGVYTTYSDRRGKKNISLIEDNFLSDVQKLKVKKYKLNFDDEKQNDRIGLVVQDIIEEKIFPELVNESGCSLNCSCEKCCSCEGCNEPIYFDETGARFHAKGVNANYIPFILIKSIQELCAEITMLKQEIEILKNK